MSITGVFFVPANASTPSTLTPLTERLRSTYGREVVPVGRWVLEHKLMRDTPSCLPASAHAPNPPPQPRYMQFLTLSQYPSHVFICASKAPDTQVSSTQTTTSAAATTTITSNMIMRTIPLHSSGALFQHFVRACEPLWCHRHTTAVTGVYFDVGDFRVRIGDVRQTHPAARARGTVVEIEWRGPLLTTAALSSSASSSSTTANGGENADNGNGAGGNSQDVNQMTRDSGIAFLPEDSDIDAEYAQVASLIREFWGRFGIPDKGLREVILVPDMGKELKERIRKLRRDGVQSAKSQTPPERLDNMKKRSGGLGEDFWSDDKSWGWGWNEQDEDPDAGVDLARQYMEIFRFNR